MIYDEFVEMGRKKGRTDYMFPERIELVDLVDKTEKIGIMFHYQRKQTETSWGHVCEKEVLYRIAKQLVERSRLE